MEEEGRRRSGYATKTCPRCGARVYEDMSVCYGCLYDFSRDGAPRAGGGAGGERDAAPGSATGTAGDGRPPGAGPEPGPGDTQDLSLPPRFPARAEDEVGMLLRTPSVDLWVPVPADGTLTLGRDPANDVVLHSPAVSRRHLRLRPTPDGMEVADLGSTNPARYRGRELVGCDVVTYGDSIEVCGCLLTMTGPDASLS